MASRRSAGGWHSPRETATLSKSKTNAMNDTPICPECGGVLSTNAPRGLCPRCLMNAALAGSTLDTGRSGSLERDPASDVSTADDGETITFPDFDTDGPEQLAGGRSTPTGTAGPMAAISRQEFERALVELGIIGAREVASRAGSPNSDLSELVRSLVQDQLLTTYQACAIRQGKSRGLLIGRYLILDRLGEGGMGVVFKARHRLLDRVVALKILPPSFARKAELVARFRREMQAAARLSHPNIVAVSDADEDRGVYFLAMEFIDGRDLDRLVRERGTLSVEQALEYTIQAARGLEAAHARGIIHRDIKPGNLMLDASGIVRVLDLGLARLTSDSSSFRDTTAPHVTRAGVFMGTVDFMAPEQAEDSHSVDHRADIYSLACTLYFLLAGRSPFQGGTVIKRLMAHQDQAPPSIRATRPDLSESLESAYLAMMAKRPEDRPQSMADVIALLDECRTAIVPPLGLQSFSRTVLQHQLANRVLADPLHSMDRDHSGWLQLEDPTSDGGLGNPPGDFTSSGNATDVPAAALVPSVRASRSWHRPGMLAAICTSIVLLGASLISFAMPRRGGNAHSPAPPGTAGSNAKPDSIKGAVTNPPVPTVVSADLAAARALKKKLEPSPATEAPSPTIHEPDTAAIVPMPKLAKVPAYTSTPIFTQHIGNVNAIRIAQNGQVALSAGEDHAVWLWRVKNGEQIVRLPHPSAVLDAAITPDGHFALTATKGKGNSNGALRLWNLRTHKSVIGDKSKEHSGAIQSVAFLPGDRALSGGQDGQVVIWNLDGGRAIGRLGAQSAVIRSHAMAVFPDGRRALTAGENGIVHVWDLITRKQLTHWSGHGGPVSDIAISADGRRAATGSHDHTVILWDVAKGIQKNRFLMPAKDRARSVAFLPDGSVLAAGGTIGQVVEWDAVSGAIRRQAEPPFVPHSDLAVLPDGRSFLTADHDGMVRLWTPREP